VCKFLAFAHLILACLLCTPGCADSSDSADSSGGAGGDPATGGSAGDGPGGESGSHPSADGAPADVAAPPDDTPRPLRYVRAEPDGALALEIRSVPGLQPRPATTAALRATLGDILDKPDGIRAVDAGALEPVGSDHEWTFEELDALATEVFDDAPDDGEIRMNVMFVDGSYSHPETGGITLGLAWGHRHIAMFAETIESGCRAAGLGLIGPLQEQACAAAELGVLTHEVGHVIGLVDNGLTMVEDHRDPDHGHHDISRDCVMYWAYEGDGLFDTLAQRLLGGEDADLQFDAPCLGDIGAAKSAP
jgi:hypothetical protein